LLNVELFDTLLEARVLTERWRVHYNTQRLHSSLGYQPPAPQLLYFMNSQPVRYLSEQTAKRVEEVAAGSEVEALVEASFRIVLSRPPNDAEQELGVGFLEQRKLTEWVHALLCSNEFIYLN